MCILVRLTLHGKQAQGSERDRGLGGVGTGGLGERGQMYCSSLVSRAGSAWQDPALTLSAGK